MTTSDPEKSSTQSPEGDQSRKRRPSTISAYDRLVALLARRDHSRLELKEKLTRAGHSPEETAATIAIATERKWLPDESVLALREGQRLARSGKSPRQIYAWLKKKGLPTDGFAADPECKDLELEGALKTASKAWLRLERAAHKNLQKKAKENGDRGSDGWSDDTTDFGGASSDRLKNEMRQKVTRFLISRGFENNTARTVFDRLWARQKNEN